MMTMMSMLSGRGKVEHWSNTTVMRLRWSTQSIILRLDGLLSVVSIFRGAVLYKVNFRFVGIVVADGIEIVGQISKIGLFVEHIDGGLVIRSLFGQSEGCIFQTTVFGSLDEDNTQTLLQRVVDLFRGSGIVEVIFIGRELVEFLFVFSWCRRV